MHAPSQNKLLELLAKYQPDGTQQEGLKLQFAGFIAQHPDCCERHCVPGHLTGSAWLVSGDGRRAALMHHRKLGRWLQPGGHADGDADLANVALREAGEETGLKDLQPSTEIFDLDCHEIPARGQEPAHWHYDMRFVVRAAGSEQFVKNDESLALAWTDIAALATRDDVDASIRRMARKWLLAD
jgi:8-oxo-dGTP pyrophosphatase MutT (NUDIX family)